MADISKVTASDGTTYDLKDTTARNAIGNLATVATSGDYDDLTNKPTIPTVNNATLTIQKNGTSVGTFTANASSNATANIIVPTKTSDLTNDSGYITGSYISVNNGRGTNSLVVDSTNQNVSIYSRRTGNYSAQTGAGNVSSGSFTDGIYLVSYSDTTAGKQIRVSDGSNNTTKLVGINSDNTLQHDGLLGNLRTIKSYYSGETFPTLVFNTLCFTLTDGQKALYTFIPMPFLQNVPRLDSVKLEVVLRHVNGGYGTVKNGTTQTALGSDYVTILNNNTIPVGGITNIEFTNLSYGGFTLHITLSEALCRASGSATAVTNNTPLAGMVRISGDIF